jgi:hypothetical protein
MSITQVGPLRDTRLAHEHRTHGFGNPASNAGQDADGIPLTPRAQWLAGLFRSGALKVNSDYLYRWALDPNTGRWHRPDAPTGHKITGRGAGRTTTAPRRSGACAAPPGDPAS